MKLLKTLKNKFISKNGTLISSTKELNTIYVGETREIKTLEEALDLAQKYYKPNNGFITISLDNFKADGITQAEYYLNGIFYLYGVFIKLTCTNTDSEIKPKIIGTNSATLQIRDISLAYINYLIFENVCIWCIYSASLKMFNCSIIIKSFNEYVHAITISDNSYAHIEDCSINTSQLSLNQNYDIISVNVQSILTFAGSIIGNKSYATGINNSFNSITYLKNTSFQNFRIAFRSTRRAYCLLTSNNTFTNCTTEASPTYNTLGNDNSLNSNNS